MKLALLPEAYLELAATIAYYEEQHPGLGVDFYPEVEATIDLEAERPGVGTPIDEPPTLRRYRVSRFPFVVWVTEAADERRVVAVAHTSRRPGYWRDREK